MRLAYYIIIIWCLLSIVQCSLPNVKATIRGKVLDKQSKLPLANIPIELKYDPGNYMIKPTIVTTTTTNANGEYTIKTNLHPSRNYIIRVNAYDNCEFRDTNLTKYQYLATGFSGRGESYYNRYDTVQLSPSASVRINYDDFILTKYNADAIIVEAGNNRVVMGSLTAFPPTINGWEPKGDIEYNLMHFNVGQKILFKYYAHTLGGQVVLINSKTIYIPNIFNRGGAPNFCPQEYLDIVQ
jgi:hypothetical protein